MNLSSIENFDKSQIFKQIVIIFAYVPVGIIAFGIIGNTICFFIFRFNKELSILSSFVILSFVAITDTLSLFVWNLNHFLVLVPGASQVEYVSLFLCKIMVFNQYWSLECSAWLLCLISIERYFTLLSVPGSFFSKIPFATKRFGIFSSVGVLVVFAFINLHIVVKNGYYDPPGLVNTTEFRIVNGSISNHTREILYQNPDFHCYYYSPTYPLNPWWDEVHLYLYSIVPLIVIVVFNGLTIYANMSKKTDLMMNSNSEVKTEFKKKNITFALLAVTFVFLVMTVPSSIANRFLYDWLLKFAYGRLIINFLDILSFVNHGILFIVSCASNNKFRKILMRNIKS